MVVNEKGLIRAMKEAYKSDGYQTSDEERQMRRGTHPLFDPPAEE